MLRHDPHLPFSRKTILAATDLLKSLRHAGFDKLLLELALRDERVGRGSSLMDRANSLAQFVLNNPETKTANQKPVSFAIVERAAQLDSLDNPLPNVTPEQRAAFRAALAENGWSRNSSGQLVEETQSGTRQEPRPTDVRDLGFEQANTPLPLRARSHPGGAVQQAASEVFPPMPPPMSDRPSGTTVITPPPEIPPQPAPMLRSGVGSGTAEQGHPIAALQASGKVNTATVNIAFDASNPRVLELANKLVAEIERQASGLRVRILDAGPTSIRVDIRDEQRREPRQFEEEVKRLRARLKSATKQITSYKEMFIEKERQIEQFIIRAARGSADPDSEKFAAILYLDVAGSATIDEVEKARLFSLLWASSALLAKKQKVYTFNSWGDAVIFAFEDPNDALCGAFGLIQTLGAHRYRTRAALTFGRVKLVNNPLRGSLDIIAGSVDEAARLEPAMKQLDGVVALASEEFRNHHEIDDVAFKFNEHKVKLEKPQGQHRAGDHLVCYEVLDKRN